MTTTYANETETIIELRRRLEDDRRTLETRLTANHHGDYELTATHGHGETELAVRDGQQTIDAALHADAISTLEAVNEALERFDSGTYGRCVSCGQAIPTERLLVIPEAARCTGCQQRAQEER
jgi:RNA polymerase-binding transcription factor DksA